MASENWRDVLKAQHDDLAHLEALDAALNENQISDDIDKILKKPVRTDIRLAPREVPQPPARRSMVNAPPPALDDSMTDDRDLPVSPAGTAETFGNKNDDLMQRNAPETADR